MSTIKLKNGVTLGYKEVGKGGKVLLSTQNFFFTDCHMELLGKPPYDYHCYLITMRGYGESDHVFDSTPQDWIKVWGQDVLAFADEIGTKQFYYTGVSHGSAAGWYTAFHQPHRLKGFVAASGVTQLTFPGGRMPGPMNLDLDRLVGNREELAKVSWNTFYPTKDPRRLARREACREEHLQIMMGRKKEEFLVRSNTMSGSDAANEEEFHQQLSQMNVPLMLLNGMLDPLSTPEKALKVASLVPGAKLVTYQHWEHAGPDECPEEAARECDRFFKDIEGRIL